MWRRVYLPLSLSLYNGPLHPALTASQRSRGKNTEGNKKLINHFVFIDQLLKVDNECTFICILLPFYVVSGGWVTFVRVSSRYQPHSNWAAQFQDIILLTSEMFNVSEVGPHERWVVYFTRRIGDIWLHPILDNPIWLLVSAILAHFPKNLFPSLEFKYWYATSPLFVGRSNSQIARIVEWKKVTWVAGGDIIGPGDIIRP